MAHSIAILSVIPRLSYHLRAQLPSLTIFDVSPDKNDTLSELEKADIVVADSNLFLPYTDKLPRLKWVQTTWAGTEKLVPRLRDKKINYVVTRFSGEALGLAMSEYVVAHIFNFERFQKQQYENQRNREWSTGGKIFEHRLISDLSVGILGLGSIGKMIAQKLKAFGATVWGVTRTQLKEKLCYIDEHRTIECLPEMLKNCDYIVNVLPSTPQTLGLLNGNVLQNCKNRGSVLINIGRGTIIKETDLLHALQEKWIAGAVLDVFEEEPLPETSELWTVAQVTISPHIAGVTRPEDVAKFFSQNYERFIKDEQLRNVLNLQDGY